MLFQRDVLKFSWTDDNRYWDLSFRTGFGDYDWKVKSLVGESHAITKFNKNNG